MIGQVQLILDGPIIAQILRSADRRSFRRHESFIFSIGWAALSATELKHLLGSATEAQKLTQEVTVHLDTFADEIIDEEAEKSFREVMALLDEAAAIKSAKANHIRQ